MRFAQFVLLSVFCIIACFIGITADCRSLRRDIAIGWKPTDKEIERLKFCDQLGE